jgi:hypothetical protein
MTMANHSGVSMPGGTSAGKPSADGPAKMEQTQSILERAYDPPAVPSPVSEPARIRQSIPTKG